MKNHILSKVFLLVVLICANHKSYPQSNGDNARVEDCLHLIYDGKFDSAYLLYPTFQPSDVHLKNLVTIFAMRWAHIPIAHSSEKDEYVKRLTEVEAVFNRLRKEQHYNLYLHITSQLLLSEFYYTNGDTGRALRHGKKVYPLLMKIFDMDIKEPELLFLRAMYLYYIDFFRSRGFIYRIVLSPFRNGDKTQGLKLLKETANTKSLAQTEALIYSAHILLHLEKKPELALPYSRKLVELYPANLKFRELLIDNLIELKRYPEADAYLTAQLETKMPYFKIPALYFSGRIEIESGKNKELATNFFQQCIDLSVETGLLEDYKEKANLQLQNF